MRKLLSSKNFHIYSSTTAAQCPPPYILSPPPTLQLTFSCVITDDILRKHSVPQPISYCSPYPPANRLLCYNRWHIMAAQTRLWSTLRASMFPSHPASTLLISYVSTCTISLATLYSREFISTDFMYTFLYEYRKI